MDRRCPLLRRGSADKHAPAAPLWVVKDSCSCVCVRERERARARERDRAIESWGESWGGAPSYNTYNIILDRLWLPLKWGVVSIHTALKSPTRLLYWAFARKVLSLTTRTFDHPPTLDHIPLYSPLYGGVQRQGRVGPLLSISLSLYLLSLSPLSSSP